MSKKDPPHHLAVYMHNLEWGGAERSMLKLTGGISTRGYKVDLVLVNKKGSLESEVPDHIRVIDFKASRALASLHSLITYLQNEKPDTLYTGLHTNLIAIWAKRLAGVSTKVVVSVRGNLSEYVAMCSGVFRVRMLPLLIRRYYRWADCVVTVSNGVAEDLITNHGVPHNKVRVIYNPVVTPEFRNMSLKHLDHPWFNAGESPVILAAGHLTAQKDFSTLIHAFSKIIKKHKVRLMILGEGEDRSMLEALIRKLELKEYIQMPGYIANPYPYMKRCSLFVLSSRWEGLPGVLIEALYCGAPIISTDCPSGPREILADGKYGKLVPIGDPLAMAQAMNLVLNGEVIHPTTESWLPFEYHNVIDQYIRLFTNQ